MKNNYNLIELNNVKSTNTEIKKYLNKDNNLINFCISASNQSNGYGRRKSKWFSYNGNIHLSLLLKPKCNIRKVNQISFITAVSIGKTLNKINKIIKVKYKWPNDIILNKKKLGGIIIETSSTNNQKINWCIIGIGLNIKKFPNLKNNEFKATSLMNEKIKLNRNIFIKLFLKIFFNNYKLWKEKGFTFIKKQWISNVYKINNNIIIKKNNRYIEGKLLNLLSNGCIKLNSKGLIKKIQFGEQVI
tara:strand:- start:282 stop:1016 length:735 start_codon:yes stop_codon:yes gene_type:complete